MEILNEANFGDVTDYDRAHYSHIKDLDEPRPVMRPKPDGARYRTRSAGAQAFGLYLQDEASDVLIDKYGLEKGKAAWAGSIGAGSNGGAMFAAAAAIANEKLAMMDDLGISLRDYFERSYFDIWKEWAATKGKDVKALKPLAPKAKPQPVAKPTPPPAPKKSSRFADLVSQIKPNPKDAMRVNDLMNKADGDRTKENQLAWQMANATKDIKKLIGRAKYAEDENYHNVAKIFYNKAEDLMNESFVSRIMKESKI